MSVNEKGGNFVPNLSVQYGSSHKYIFLNITIQKITPGVTPPDLFVASMATKLFHPPTCVQASVGFESRIMYAAAHLRNRLGEGFTTRGESTYLELSECGPGLEGLGEDHDARGERVRARRQAGGDRVRVRVVHEVRLGVRPVVTDVDVRPHDQHQFP